MAAGERIILDPISEHVENVPLELTSAANGLFLVEHSYPPPEKESSYAPSAETEGDPLVFHRRRNRAIKVKLRLHEPQLPNGVNLAMTPTSERGPVWTGNARWTQQRTQEIRPPEDVGGEWVERHDRTAAAFADSMIGVQPAALNLTLPAAGRYAVSSYLWIPSDAGWVTASSPFIAMASFVGTTTVALIAASLGVRNAWQKITGIFDILVTDLVGYIYLGSTTAPYPAVGEYLYSAGLQVEQIAAPVTTSTAFFSGDMAGVAWAGEPGNSWSIRKSGGGARRDAIIADLQKKVAKVDKEGGTYKRIMPNGQPIVFDVIGADVDPAFEKRFAHSGVTTIELDLAAKPFGRGLEKSRAAASETIGPVLVFTVADIEGDVPALGRLIVKDLEGKDQWWGTYGLESRDYSASPNAALFYEAESCTPLSTSSLVSGPSGASGSGNNVVRQTNLFPSYFAVLSTQAASGGNHLTHKGTFRVYARVYCPSANRGNVDVCWEWALGDFRRRTLNEPVSPAVTNNYCLLDLGTITIPRDVTQWEGRLLGRSSVAGDDIDVDYLLFVPCERSGVAKAILTPQRPSAFAARDEFSGVVTGAVLHGRSAPTGGSWSTSGAITDFTGVDATNVLAPGSISRATTLEVSSRLALLGSTNYSGCIAHVYFQFSNTYLTSLIAQAAQAGLIARYVDASNFFSAFITRAFRDGKWRNYLEVGKVLDGTYVELARVAVDIAPLVYSSLYLMLMSDGRGLATVSTVGKHPTVKAIVPFSGDASLATGGALASGRVGLTDTCSSSTVNYRAYDNFWIISTATPDAVMFASRSLIIGSSQIVREDSSGVTWTPVSSFEGDYLRVPVAGAENRKTRFLVKATRSDPALSADAAIDDIQATLYYTPRYLTVPEPA